MIEKKILVGIDGSDSSNKAAEFAALIASKNEAVVTLIYVGPDPGPETIMSRYVPKFKIALTKDEEEQADRIFERAEETMNKNGVNFDTLVLKGNPASLLLLEQSKKGYDMIVVGSRGFSAVKEFLVSSVSARLAHHTMIPVLVVP
jgi:nucleotide-binding universal stress UspA family protein